MSWLVKLVLNSLALVLASHFVQGFAVSGIFSTVLAAIILGVVNTLIKPILIVLTLPITVITLGLFILVLNAITFTIASWFVPGFQVYSFAGAFWGALITSLFSWLLNLIFG